MRVAVVTQYFPASNQVWAGHSAYQTLRVLAKSCELHVFYPEAQYLAGLAPSTSRREPLDRAWQPEGVSVTYIPYPTLPVVGRPLNGFSMAFRLREAVRKYRPDVILNYVVYPDGLAATSIGHSLGRPVVLTAIGSDLNRIPGKLVERLTVRTLQQAMIVTTVSRDLARTAVRLGAARDRTVAILNGCDTAVFQPHADEANPKADARAELGVAGDAELIVYVGRLDVRKGLIELIDAVTALRRRRPAVRCCIVGDGSDRPALVEAITRTNAEEYVKLVPPCPTAAVARWMQAADLVTLPSYKEGCPNVVIEALASGRPVVATDVGGIPELMDESCGALVPPRDVPALLEALDSTLGRQWSATNISARHSRSWADVAQDLHAVLARAADPALPTSY